MSKTSNHNFALATFIKDIPIVLAIVTTTLSILVIGLRKLVNPLRRFQGDNRVHPLLKEPLFLTIFLIQVCYLVMCLIDITFTTKIETQMCKTLGAIFYSLTMSAFLFMNYFQLIIFLRLTSRDACIRRFNIAIVVGIILFPLFNFCMYPYYLQCGIDDFLFYCGVCGAIKTPPFVKVLVGINYLLPVILGLMMFGLIFYCYWSNFRNNDRISRDHKISLFCVYIPALDLLFIILSGVVTLVGSNVGTHKFYLLLVGNSLLFLPPLVDMVCLLVFMKKFGTNIRTAWLWKKEDHQESAGMICLS